METPEQEFCQHALIVHKSEDIGKQRRSLKWLEEFSRHPNCWRSVLKVLSINWSPAAKQEIVWGQAATVRAHLNAGAYCNRWRRNYNCPMYQQILLRHLRVCDDAQKPFAKLIYHVCKTHLIASLWNMQQEPILYHDLTTHLDFLHLCDRMSLNSAKWMSLSGCMEGYVYLFGQGDNAAVIGSICGVHPPTAAKRFPKSLSANIWTWAWREPPSARLYCARVSISR